jgi:hypothetical protein
METMTRVSAVRSPVVASQIDGSFDEDDRIYQNVRLIGADQDKLVALCDSLLFYCAAARLRTRPVTITEAEGCARITWSRYAPAVFRNSPLLGIVAGGELIDHVTVQESRTSLS